jgi:hypothetical protein
MIRELKQAEYDMVKMAEAADSSQQRQREKLATVESKSELPPRSISPIRDTSAERQAA